MPPFSVVVSTRECLTFLSCPSSSIGHPCVFYRGTITSSGFPLITCGNDSGGGACGNDSDGGACGNDSGGGTCGNDSGGGTCGKIHLGIRI